MIYRAISTLNLIFTIIITEHSDKPAEMDNLISDTASQKKPNNLDAIKVLTVKAIEENSKKIIKPMDVSSANISAIGAKNDDEFVEKRAEYLFNNLPRSLKNLALIEHFPGSWMKITVLVSFIVGLLSNYLGPSQLIHVVYNPLTILLAWTTLVYLLIILRSFLKINIPDIKNDIKQDESNLEEKNETEDTNDKSSGKILDWIIGGIFKGVVQFRARFIDDNTYVNVLKNIIPSFWKSYKEVAGKSLILKYKSLVNSSAVALLAGAIVGVYFRGLFFNYNMVWASTFISEPATIKTILNVLFGFASLIIEGSWITNQDVADLLQTGGSSAGSWIHKMALTCLFVIFIPRTILAIWFSKKAGRSNYKIDLDDTYYIDILQNREAIIGIINDGVRDIISKKINKIGQTISDFVIKDYYEKIIAPILVGFREKGGKIRTLENKLLESQDKFEPILLKYLEELQEDFQDTILTEINLFLGRKLDIDINTISNYQPQSDETDQRITSRIAADIGDTIGGTIVTTVSLAAGAVSGGIGKSLGIAIISGLLGVSGPIGILIGGLITAVTLGGVYTLKREQISGMLKDVPLPAIAIKATLTDSKIEKTRKEIYTHTETEIKKMLQPKIEEVSHTITKDLTY